MNDLQRDTLSRWLSVNETVKLAAFAVLLAIIIGVFGHAL